MEIDKVYYKIPYTYINELNKSTRNSTNLKHKKTKRPNRFI